MGFLCPKDAEVKLVKCESVDVKYRECLILRSGSPLFLAFSKRSRITPRRNAIELFKRWKAQAVALNQAYKDISNRYANWNRIG